MRKLLLLCLALLCLFCRPAAAQDYTILIKGGHVIDPLNNIGPDEIYIRQLFDRIKNSSNGHTIKEIILATNPTMEGEATAMYISKLLKPLGIKVTRIAHGIPVGGELEYADEVTLAKALEGRREL